VKLNTKIIILVILFCLKGIFHLVDGITAIIAGMSYADYSDAFINAGIMAFIAYTLYATRNKWAYWIAVIFSGIVLVRFVLGIGLPLFWDTSLLTTSLVALAILNALVFGAIPLILLSNKELRNSFLEKK